MIPIELLQREYRLRKSSDAGAVLMPAAVTAFVTAMPADPVLLRAAAPAILLSTLLPAAMIGSEKMFADDLRSGAVLRLLAHADATQIVIAKMLMHWWACWPSVLMALPCALVLQLPITATLPLTIAAVLWGFSALAMVPASCGGGGPAVSAALLPLPIPVLIFGSTILSAPTASIDPSTLRQAEAFLTACVLFVPAAAVLLGSSALRRSVQDAP